MSKVILVMDMPESCIDCPLHFDDDPEFWCGATQKDLRTDDIETYKPDWCPLKPVPDKITDCDFTSLIQIGVKKGWNDCVDEILKGAEE